MWKSPFNNVVRSKEALFIGLLSGMVLGGVIGSFLVPTVIQGDVYDNPIIVCGKLENVESVTFTFHGILDSVSCKDGRKIDDFKFVL